MAIASPKRILAINPGMEHETLQRFMLVNDSVTVAVEIPVFLTKEDLTEISGSVFSCSGFLS